MKKELHLSIPTPCHESWNNMTPTQQGRFCAVCSKQVVDFTMMTDQQLINFFTNQKGNTCGRFMKDQLERPITQRKEEKKKAWWLLLIMPVMLCFNRSHAQAKKGKPQIEKCTQDVFYTRGDVQIKEATSIGDTSDVSSPMTLIKGKVTDKEGLALRGASIQLKGTRAGTSSDSAGNFTISVKSSASTKATLVISYVGYESKEVEVGSLKNQQEIVLDETEIKLAQVVAGGIAFIEYPAKKKRLPKADSLVTSFHKFLGRETFKTFPNPARRGESVQVQLKKAGSYVIELLDQQSKTISTTHFDAHVDGEDVRITIPANITTGMYFITLTDEKYNTRYTNKIIVE